MPIDAKDLYDQAFQAQRHASDFRAGIMAAWLAIYAAFAGLFVWVQGNQPHLTRLVAFLAALVILLMWLAEHRNRPAIKRAKEIGRSIEEDPTQAIPVDRRFFCAVEKGVSHSTLIDIFGAVSLILAVAAFFLL